MRLIDPHYSAASLLDRCCRRRRWWSEVIRLLQTRRPAFDRVIFEQPIEPLPQIAVLHRRETAITLPLPVVFSPVGQALLQAAADRPAAGEQRHAGGLAQRFESANDGQQLQPLGTGLLLFVCRFERRLAAR